MDNETQKIALEIIAYSGEARSVAFSALQAAKNNQFEEANSLMKQAEEIAKKAHKTQTELLINEAQGNKISLDILLIHAQDHLMTCMLAFDLIKELIELYKSKRGE